jgi:hypothetical protein
VASTEIVASNDALGVVHARHFVGGRGSTIGNEHPDPPYNIRHGVTGDRYGTGVRLAEDPPARRRGDGCEVHVACARLTTSNLVFNAYSGALTASITITRKTTINVAT